MTQSQILEIVNSIIDETSYVVYSSDGIPLRIETRKAIMTIEEAKRLIDLSDASSDSGTAQLI